MLYSANTSETLLRSFKEELGVDYDQEEMNELIMEISEKYSIESDVEKLHPLTRAFLNLEENMKFLRNRVVHSR